MRYNHLVFTVRNGWIEFRMGNQMGSHPIGDDIPQQIIDYIRKITQHETYEIIWT
jgi:hypothetical protein